MHLLLEGAKVLVVINHCWILIIGNKLLRNENRLRTGKLENLRINIYQQIMSGSKKQKTLINQHQCGNRFS